MLFAFTPDDLRTWGVPIGAGVGLIIGLVQYFRNQSKKK
jgi:hypothetical protein